MYAFSFRQQIPKFMLPLPAGDKEPVVDLQALLQGVYSRARFDMAIDYTSYPVPPLKEDERVWADTLLLEKKLR